MILDHGGGLYTIYAHLSEILVGEGDEIMLISSSGTLIRTPVDDISIQGRNTQGVRLIRVEEGQRLVGVARIEPMGDEDEE